MKKLVLIALVVIFCSTFFTALAENNTPDKSIYEYAFKRECSEYTIYYLFDIDGGITRCFATNDNGVLVGTITGTLETTIEICYMEGWYESFKLKDPEKNTAILIDSFGFEWEYELSTIEEAEEILNQDSYYDMEL